jgi:L-histidine Nalpha-methyltransferase
MSSGVTDARSALHDATVEQLRAHPKELPAVWLYDERGAQLYERIMQLPEYYLPRREAEVLRSHAPEIATRTKARTLVELGAGSASNTRYLLDALERARTLERFVPFDASPEMLELGARAVAAAYPRVSVDAVVGDFEHDLDKLPRRGPRLVTFLGSTIGNLHADERVKLLGALAAILEKDDALVIGVDLVKDVVRLEAAYNDASGVTEAFVRNALAHVNRELDATFDQRRFAYEARWDPANEWMDMGLRAREVHSVQLQRPPIELTFAAGEWLRVEISTKFRRAGVERDAGSAGLTLESWWTDAAGDFGVALLSGKET